MAGPYVSAGVTFVQFVLNLIFPKGDDLLGNIQKIASNVVERIEYFHENKEITDRVNALADFLNGWPWCKFGLILKT